MSLKEYIVTLRDFNDLDNFYDDMETPGGSVYVPNRKVEVAHRRNISRNTHYYLTEQEVTLLKNDPRVLDIHLNPFDAGLEIVPYGTIIKDKNAIYRQSSSYWNKNDSVLNDNGAIVPTDPKHDNWGLLRCYEGTNRPTWGEGSSLTGTAIGTIDLTSTGRNVDVVIADGIMKPGHPQWKSLDNTSVDRNKRYNWHLLNNIVGSPYTGSYDYDGRFSNLSYKDQNNHGTHVAGTVAGYAYGWAKNANIYNIFPYDSQGSSYLIDYVRAFHLYKPINPVTGRKNPTIVNMSYGYRTNVYANQIVRCFFQGKTYNIPATGWTTTDYNNFGWSLSGPVVQMAYRASFVDADITDAINAGVVLVAAAGNENAYSDVPGGKDYNNSFVAGNSYGGETAYYYHRGSSQGGVPGGINVGATDNWYRLPKRIDASGLVYGAEYKAGFSNAGPRIDVFAPGTAIMSSWGIYTEPSTSPFYYSFVDPLSYGGVDYYTNKIQGTSMASPQVAGMLACHAEVLQNIDQTDAINILIKNSQKDALTSTAFDSTYPSTTLTTWSSIRNSPNRYLKYVKEIPSSGVLYPKNNYNQQYYLASGIQNTIDPDQTKSNSVVNIFSIPKTTDVRNKAGWTSFLSNNGLRFNYGEKIDNNYIVNFPHNGFYDFRFSVDYFGTVSLDGIVQITGSTPVEYFYKSIFVSQGTHVINVNAVHNPTSLTTSPFAVAFTISYNSKIKNGITYPRPKIRRKG